MAIITLSNLLVAGRWSIGHNRFDQEEVSDPSGHTAARLMGPPRWSLSMGSPDKRAEAQSALWQVMVVGLRGKVNHLAAWDIVRPAPVGTMRGALTLNGAHAAGVATLSITGGVGQAATTLKACDWLQIGSGLGTSCYVMVMADATANASGVISVAIEPPLRIGFSSGAVVAWDKPLCHYKQTTKASNWSYDAGWLTKSGYSLDLLEHWQ